MDNLGEAIGGLSAGGILLLLVIREFLNHMSKKQEATAKPDDCADGMDMLVEKVDSSGLPLVYRDQKLPDAVDGLGKSIERLGNRVEKLGDR